MLVFTLGVNGALMGGRSGCLWAALSPLRLFWGVLGGHCQSSASFLRQATCLPPRTCSPAAWLGAWPWAGELQVPMNRC